MRTQQAWSSLNSSRLIFAILTAPVAGARNFYEMQGMNIGGIEGYLGEIESRFGPARDKLLSSEDLEALTENDRRVLAYFAATQFVWTLEIRWLVRDLAAEIKASLLRERMSAALAKEARGRAEEETPRLNPRDGEDDTERVSINGVESHLSRIAHGGTGIRPSTNRDHPR
jgi:hypothetical protein